MDKETLKKVQQSILEIAAELHRVCELLGIEYFMQDGTLLGAVRHGGFIPWDDDMDFGMLRPAYERFLAEAPAVLRGEYYIQTWRDEKHYGLPFAKLRKKNTVYVEEESSPKLKNNGVYVDIFPFDVYPAEEKQRKHQKKPWMFCHFVLLAKSGQRIWRESTGVHSLFVHAACLLMSLIPGRKWLIDLYEKNAVQYNDQETGEVYIQGLSLYGRAVLPVSYLTPVTRMKFEDREFYAPVNYDDFLSYAYGDYMQLPPENQRENRHRILDLKL